MSLFQRLNSIKTRTPDQPRETRTENPVLIPGSSEISSNFGKCLLLEDMRHGNICFPDRDPALLLFDLKLIRGIGPVTEAKLQDQGYSNISALHDHPRWGYHARHVENLIEKRHINELRLIGARDHALLSYFDPSDLLFLDIETTGLWASQPLFLIGLLYYKDDKIYINQFLARHYREEKAVLSAANEVIQNFKVVVSFNGKRFDLPYISGRSIEHRLFYSYPHHQVDLLHHARRRYRDLLPDCRLVTLEEHLLDFRRDGDIPGYLIPETYHRFTQKQEAGLIQPVLEHNKLDLLTMAKLLASLVMPA